MRIQNSEFRIQNPSTGGRRSVISDCRLTSAFLQPRAAFTLVELLVSVALVILMMSMFAEIFQLTTGAMSTQRGVAENDQRARSFAIVIRGDVDKRTFRNVIPFFPGEDAGTSPTSFSDRRGYFYISENDPYDDTDDVFQFTIDASITTRNRDETPFYGKATLLAAQDPSNPGTPLPTSLLQNWNQPEADDAQTVRDETSISPCAEVSYFLRNGNLFRRMLLIRKPLALAGADAQPRPSNSANEFFLNSDYFVMRPSRPVERSGAFWYDFDFSAHYLPSVGCVMFNGIADLDNSGAGGQFPLGQPFNRFGYNHRYAPTNAGQPREFVGTDFIGRFTHQETSFFEDVDSDGSLDPGEDRNGNGALDEPFGYPHSIRSGGNPMNRSTALTFTNGVVGDANGTFDGPRRSEDILMNNVHSFDVKIWDDLIGGFVDVGHAFDEDLNGNGSLDSGEDANDNGVIDDGDFNQSRRRPVAYGPSTTAANNRIFDTWHPGLGDFDDADGDSDLATGVDDPPFRPMVYYPVLFDAANGKPEWHVGSYALGDVVVPRETPPNQPPISPVFPIDSFVFAYRVVNVTGAGNTGATEPHWPTADDLTVVDGDLTWRAVFNLKSLRAIQITVRFNDVSSGQLRQMTLVHSLID